MQRKRGADSRQSVLLHVGVKQPNVRNGLSQRGPLRRTTCTDIVATAKAGTLSFCVTRRKRRPLTEFRKLAAKAAWKRRRPAPPHKHPVLRGPNREIIRAERSPRSLVLSSTRLFPSPGGWVGEKFSLNHSTDEPKASAGELQPSW